MSERWSTIQNLSLTQLQLALHGFPPLSPAKDSDGSQACGAEDSPVPSSVKGSPMALQVLA